MAFDITNYVVPEEGAIIYVDYTENKNGLVDRSDEFVIFSQDDFDHFLSVMEYESETMYIDGFLFDGDGKKEWSY